MPRIVGQTRPERLAEGAATGTPGRAEVPARPVRGHAQRHAVEPGAREIADDAARRRRHDQRQRAGPECFRQPARIGVEHAAPRGRQIGHMRDQRIEFRALFRRVYFGHRLPPWHPPRARRPSRSGRRRARRRASRAARTMPGASGSRSRVMRVDMGRSCQNYFTNYRIGLALARAISLGQSLNAGTGRRHELSRAGRGYLFTLRHVAGLRPADRGWARAGPGRRPSRRRVGGSRPNSPPRRSRRSTVSATRSAPSSRTARSPRRRAGRRPTRNGPPAAGTAWPRPTSMAGRACRILCSRRVSTCGTPRTWPSRWARC